MTYKLEACDYDEAEKVLLDGLKQYNLTESNYFSKYGYALKKKFSFCIFDGDKIIGGISGWIKVSYWLHVDLLYIEPEYRNNDLASSLMRKAEDFARENNLVGITLETWSFQAKGFYEKLGYKVYGKIENSPPGEIEYLLKKDLVR